MSHAPGAGGQAMRRSVPCRLQRRTLFEGSAFVRLDNQDPSKWGAVETGCSDVYDVMY